jgi:hypothetical protein
MSKLVKPTKNFTQVGNEIFSNNRVSAKAKGVYCYLWSKPDGWDFSHIRISQEFSDGRKGILSAINELEDCGYLERKRQKDGRMDYILSICKVNSEIFGLDKPQSPNRSEPFGLRAEKGHISNTDNEVIQNISNTELAKQSFAWITSDINEILETFSKFNSAINYGNKTQRLAVEHLLSFMGKEKLIGTIKYCESIMSKKYAPVITTPIELKNNLTKLIAYYQKENTGGHIRII